MSVKHVSAVLGASATGASIVKESTKYKGPILKGLIGGAGVDIADDGNDLTFTFDATEITDLALSRGAVAAAGTNAATATAISVQVAAVTASDGAKGVALPAAATTTGPIWIINTVTTAGATLKVYPVSGGNDNINGLSEDAAFTMGPGMAALFVPTSATQWYVAENAGTTFDVATYESDAVALSPLKWVDVAVTAALLDAAGTVNVIAGVAGDQYKVREVVLVGGGTNYAAGGDRNISLTDGTTVWTTVANADIESAPAASLRWGDAKVPFLTSTSNTASVAGEAIRFAYSGGTTDHSATGSITFSVLLEKVA